MAKLPTVSVVVLRGSLWIGTKVYAFLPWRALGLTCQPSSLLNQRAGAQVIYLSLKRSLLLCHVRVCSSRLQCETDSSFVSLERTCNA